MVSGVVDGSGHRFVNESTDYMSADETMLGIEKLGSKVGMADLPGGLGTCGGIRADEKAHAVRTDGTPMENLYAIRNTAGNVFGGV